MASTWCRLVCQSTKLLRYLFRKRHQRPKSDLLRRFFSGNLSISLGFTVLASEINNNEENDRKLQIPDPSTLTTEYLVRNAASLTLDNACSLLSQTTIALSDVSREYMKNIFVLIKLMEYKLQILGNSSEENKVWDLILQARNNVDEAKRKKMNLQMLHTTVQNIVTSTAEAAFLAGAEHSSNIGSERLYSSERYLREVNYAVEQVEQQLREAEAKTIEVETKHAEEQEKQKLKDINSENTEESDNT